jgi:hypothetical protein
MTPQQLDLDLAGLEIEVLDLIPVDALPGEHGVTEIGASCQGCTSASSGAV